MIKQCPIYIRFDTEEEAMSKIKSHPLYEDITVGAFLVEVSYKESLRADVGNTGIELATMDADLPTVLSAAYSIMNLDWLNICKNTSGVLH